MAKRNTQNKRQKMYRRKRRTMKGGMDEIEDIPLSNESHHVDMYDLNLDDSFTSNGPLNLSDLGISRMSGNTDNNSSFDSNESVPLNYHDDMNESFTSQAPLTLSDLDTTVNTTEEDISFGGKRRRKITKKRHEKKTRKTRKNRRKQRGGICYGNGVGANNYDPNYSIYNTNMLKLFPYKA